MAESDPPRQARLPASQRQWILVPAIIFATAIVWAGWAWWADRRYRDLITAIELEMANGRFAIAARDLTSLLEHEPDSDEAAFLLGRCEQERARTEAAAKAFARIAPGSAFAHKAILARMRLFHDKGQFAAAEQLINEVAEDPRSDRAHVRALLVPIYSQLGRLDEAQRLLEDWWEHLNETGEGASEPAIDQVRMHIELAFRPNPVENVRAYLDQAHRLAPDEGSQTPTLPLRLAVARQRRWGKPDTQPSGKPDTQPSGKPDTQPSGKPDTQTSGEAIQAEHQAVFDHDWDADGQRRLANSLSELLDEWDIKDSPAVD
jgi:tetratricopeptide (TPR) repeat protein